MNAEPKVSAELASEHGLDASEWKRLLDSLGRAPSYTELGMASVMWSEHCSYKSSRVHLKKLPTEGPQVLIGPGENAGVVDIGDNQAVVFKMESHNHPSFIEPYQGAATGVGGICRDVFTMGARPIAVADCLRFGEPTHPRTNYLVSGVVAGVGDYGNSFGVPNVAGDVAFHSGYNGNILVNAFCLGLAPADKIFLGTASGVGNPILYVGAKTGRDGIHGATMASAEFGEDAEEKRPTVQVGDPFMEKLLLEACLELMQSDAIVGIQDMGAAGLTSSSVEMAARARSGVEMDLDRVPMRESEMTPYELMLSESQERMLLVAHKGREHEVMRIFEKWDLDAAVVGQVTDSGRVVVRMNGETFADIPSSLLADGVVYDRPFAEPASFEARKTPGSFTLETSGSSVSDLLLRMLATPNIASKQWVFRQYDYNVRHGTVVRPGESGAGVVRVLAGDRVKGVAITAGCAARWVELDPFEGTRLVVAEAFANLVSVGAAPLAVTNCLNFGNPERPEIMWQLAESIRGLGDACRLLDTPVVSGNVSLYNETDGAAIRPTPMIGMVGLIDDLEARPSSAGFGSAGNRIALVCAAGEIEGVLAGSELFDELGQQQCGRLRTLDSKHVAVMRGIRELRGALDSCTDVSDGGLLVTLGECAAQGGRGVEVALPPTKDPAALLFGEGPARFVVSYRAEMSDEIKRLTSEGEMTLVELGTVTSSGRFVVTGAIDLDLATETLALAFTTGFAASIGLD